MVAIVGLDLNQRNLLHRLTKVGSGTGDKNFSDLEDVIARGDTETGEPSCTIKTWI